MRRLVPFSVLLPATLAFALPGCQREAGQPAGAAADVAATLSEWRIELGQDSLNAGRTRFLVRNEGQYRHAFEIEGGGEEWETAELAPGADATLEAELRPGTYEVYCPVQDERGNHEQLGMRATLVVR